MKTADSDMVVHRSHLGGAPVPDANDAGTAAVYANGIYTSLRARIVEGDIPPETRLNIDAISRESGISQTPVREALQRLEGDGLVVSQPARGYSTTPMLDLDGLTSLFEFRFLIEPWTARAAAVDTLTNPAPELEHEIETFQKAIDEGGDIRREMLTHDTRFHNAIIAASRNPTVAQAYLQTHCHLHVFRLYSVDLDGSETMAEHRAIWEAVRDCRPDDAETLMAQHIKHSFRRSSAAFPAGAENAGMFGGQPPRRPSMAG
jgi:DNA-binding GntR family transcriptional regulator